MELWELIAREPIRDTLARYNWGGDALRLDEMAGAFCADGGLEVRGQDVVRGRQAIVAMLGGVASGADDVRAASTPGTTVRRIVRHNLTNARFLEVTPHEAKVASYFTVVTEIGLDHYGRYRDTLVPVGDDWLIAHRFVSTDRSAPNSAMAAQK